MEYRELGRTGLTVSVVGYGTAPLGDMFGTSDEDAALQSAHRALDAGINFFDSSPSYGKGLAEERLGKVLRGRRHEIIVGTKAGKYGPDEFDFSADRIRRGVEESLRRLGTDYVDILQLHDVEFADLEGPIGEGYAELVRLREAGMCRLIGMTGYPTAMTRRVMSEYDLDVTLSYAHCTLLDACLTDDVLPLAQEREVGVINAAAVALGLLTQAGPPPHIAQVVGDQFVKLGDAGQSLREAGLGHPPSRLVLHLDVVVVLGPVVSDEQQPVLRSPHVPPRLRQPAEESPAP